MNNLKKRVEKIEDKLLDDEKYLNAEDIRLILSGLPIEYANLVREKILTGDYQETTPRLRSIEERREEMELILQLIEPSNAAQVRQRLEARGYRPG
jgi:two-component SAPR family response regulator